MHTELRFRIFSTDFVPNPFSALFLKLSGTFFLSHSCWLLEGLFSRWITLSTFFVFWLDFFSCSSAVCPPMASKSNKWISLTVNKRKSLFLETASFLFLAGKWRKKLVVNFVFLHHFFSSFTGVAWKTLCVHHITVWKNREKRENSTMTGGKSLFSAQKSTQWTV